MLIFEELLESYSRLRKRRYSFSDSLLVEGVLSNFVISALRITSKEEAQTLLNAVQSRHPWQEGAYQKTGRQYQNIGMAPLTAMAPKNGSTVTTIVAGSQGDVTAANPDSLIEYLSNWEEEGVSEPKAESVEGGGFSPALNIGEQNPELVADFTDVINKIAELAPDELKEPVQVEVEDLMARVLGESEKTNTTLSRVINAFGAGDFDLSVQAIEEFVSDLGSLVDILQTHKDSGEQCLDITNEGQRQVLNRFFFRKGGDRLHYGTNDGTNPPGMMGGFKFAGTIKTGKDFVSVSNRDRAYGISVATPGGVLKDVLGEFSSYDTSICGERDSKGDPVPIVKPAKTAGQGFYTARSQLAEVSDILAHKIEVLKDNPTNSELRREILKILRVVAKASEKHINAFRKTVNLLGQYDVPLLPEYFRPENMLRDFKELESDFSTPSVEIALKLISREIALSRSSKPMQVLKSLGITPEYRGQEFENGKSIEKTTGFQYGLGDSSLSVEVIKGDSIIRFSSDEEAIAYLEAMGSNLKPDSVRYRGMVRTHQVSNKAKSATKDTADGASDLGTRRLDGDVDWESSERATEIHIQALVEQGMPPAMGKRIRDVERREKTEVSYVNECFLDPIPEVKKNPDANTEDLKEGARNLPVLISRLKKEAESAAGEDALSFQTHILFLEDYVRDPEALMDKEGIGTEEKLLGHAKSRALTCLTVLAVKGKDRNAKHIRDVANIGCATSEMSMTLESFGRERHDVMQSKLVDAYLVKIAKGEVQVRTTKSGALSSYSTYVTEGGETKERTCFTTSTRENKGMRTGVTVSGAHVVYTANSKN